MSRPVWNIQFDIGSGMDRARSLAEAIGVSPLTAILLINRGMSDPASARAFLETDDGVLHDPFALADMDKAARRVEEAIASGEGTVIYGDYDVDGVTAVSVLYTYLRSRGLAVEYYIPTRSGDGYGISAGALDELASRGIRLLISVDCGITAVEEVEYARSLGVDCVITDHHECQERLPDAVAVVDPRRADCPYPFKGLAGVGVAFNLVCALEIARLPDEDPHDVLRRMCEDYCDLVAVGTVADIMPLSDFNRYIVTLGLRALASPARPGLAALCETAAPSRAENARVTSSFIGFNIAPKLNAAGRLDDASLAVELMLDSDPARARELAARLVELNRERQETENAIYRQATEKIRAEHDFENDPVIVVGEEGWHHGVIGIVASRVTEYYRMPSIMISFDADGTGKGSGRSVKGFNLVRALGECGGLLIRYGGHELAAGLTISRDKLDDFKRALNEYARASMPDGAADSAPDVECALSGDMITCENIDELSRLEPFGITNPTPRFAVCDAVVCDVAAVGSGKHTRLTVEVDGRRYTAMYFNAAADTLFCRAGDRVDMICSLDVNEYMGRRTPQMTVRRLFPCAAVRGRVDAMREAYRDAVRGAGGDAASVLPVRAEFAAVYRELCSRFSRGADVFYVSDVARAAGLSGLGFVKVKLIADVLCELRLIDASCREAPGDDLYSFRVLPVRGKTNLDKSHILARLREDLK